MTTRFMRLGLFGSMIVLLAVGFIFFDTTAQAQQEDKTTDATVVTGGVAPIIECKWELRDLQVGVIDSTFPDGVVQYEDSQGNANDDDPNVVPDADNDSGNGTQIPCTGPENDPPTGAGQREPPGGISVNRKPNFDRFPNATAPREINRVTVGGDVGSAVPTEPKYLADTPRRWRQLAI